MAQLAYATLGANAMTQARTEPPSEARIADARAARHVPRAELVPRASAWCVAVVLLLAFAGQLVNGFQGMVRAALATAAAPERAPLAEPLHGPLTALALGVGILLVALAFFMLLAQATAQGFVFSPRRRRPRRAFGHVSRTSWLSTALGVVALAVVLGTLLHSALRVEPDSFAALLWAFASRAGLLLVLVSLLDAVLSRASWWRSLHLTRREAADELREAYGSAALHAARERARHAPMGRP
jgi:flagellar biosynthesis protein FlhB